MPDAPISTQVSLQYQMQRNFHYLRYVVVSFFLLALSHVPDWLDSDAMERATVGLCGVGLVLLCIIIDIRNYVLFRQEEDWLRSVLKHERPYGRAVVTFSLLGYYLLALVVFLSLATTRVEQRVALDDAGARRLGRAELVTVKKIRHLTGGWAAIRAESGDEFFVKHEEIRFIHATTQRQYNPRDLW